MFPFTLAGRVPFAAGERDSQVGGRVLRLAARELRGSGAEDVTLAAEGLRFRVPFAIARLGLWDAVALVDAGALELRRDARGTVLAWRVSVRRLLMAGTGLAVLTGILVGETARDQLRVGLLAWLGFCLFNWMVAAATIPALFERWVAEASIPPSVGAGQAAT